jgi:hypothetical protein
MAAVLGLVLALVDCGWAILETKDDFRYASARSSSGHSWDFKYGFHQLISRVRVPCCWFGLSGILYALTDIALLKLMQQGEKEDDGPDGTRESPPRLAEVVRG